MCSPRLVTASVTLLLSSPIAFGQFDHRWVEFAKDPAALSAPAISDPTIETDLAWGDLDQDGWIDLVVVRKEPFTSPGKRTNVLLMNLGGVLTDRTVQYASASDVPGDQGFLTPTNDRDVVIADVDGDGFDDVVTATTISDGDPKHIGHPRVYMNRGGAAPWLGLRHEDARMPQLFHYTTGNPENPRFCAVAAGDVTGDGAPDLYFADYDSSGAGGAQQNANQDLNDRLLINDGNGFFTDQSQSRMTTTMLTSAFGMAAVIADMNGDGKNDIVKDTALNPPQHVGIAYNNLLGPPTSLGVFDLYEQVHQNEPYHVSAGDLNNDGRLDLVVSDDGKDRFRFNLGNDALGRVQWSASHTFSFLTGADDGFASNNVIADLDGDGWNDVLICDVDVDIPSNFRRMHVYRNLGVSGQEGTAITLREERQNPSSLGWIGVTGMTTADLASTHDVAVFDVDNDMKLDLVVSRFDGTDVWKNGTSVDIACQPDLGYGGTVSYLAVCGGDLSAGNDATLRVENIPFVAQMFLFVGTGNNPTFVYELGGTLVTVPLVAMIPITSFGKLSYELPVPGGIGPISATVQLAYVKSYLPTTYELTNGVQITWP